MSEQDLPEETPTEPTQPEAEALLREPGGSGGALLPDSNQPLDAAIDARLEAREQEVAALQETHEQEVAALQQTHAQLEQQLAAAQLDHLAAVRRALLAEHAGQVVPELVQGHTAEELEASLATARQAFDRIASELRQQAASMVPLGASASAPPSPDALTPIQKITHALSRSGR